MMQRKRLPIRIIAASLWLLSIVLAIVVNYATSQAYVPYSWYAVGFVFIAGIILIAVQDHLQAPGLTVGSSNRRVLLGTVHRKWITDVLDKSLGKETDITLDLHELSNDSERSAQLVIQQANQSMLPLPSGTRIVQVYDDVDTAGQLLILGGPGSGKTTLLLELTRDLLEQAKLYKKDPIPVVFNLSSWAIKQQPIADWLISELHSKYNVSPSIGQSWVESHQILPLLDGLDEVSKDHRVSCVQHINTYLQEHTASAVVCCRSDDYRDLAQEARLPLRTVVIQPLTEEQVDNYLSRAGKRLESLQLALTFDPVLKELASMPLMLSVLALTYQGKTIEELQKDLQRPGMSEEQRKQVVRWHVFEQYIKRMFELRRGRTRYTPQQAKHWLTWLAQQLTRHNQGEFYIEHMQSSWLPPESSSRLLRRFASVQFWFMLMRFNWQMNLQWLFLGNYVLGQDEEQDAGETEEDREIKPVEKIIWSWAGMWRSLARFLGIVLTVGLIFLLLNILIIGLPFVILPYFVWFVVMAIGGLVIAVIGGLRSGFSSETLNEHNRLTPNEGIWRSMRNSLLVGLPLGLLFGIFSGLMSALFFGFVGGLLFGVGFGLLTGSIVGLRTGGSTFFRHFLLRWHLWRTSCMPWNYPHFLDEAAERILLRKVGGGYIFIHPLLLNHFATLDTLSHAREDSI